MVVTWWSRGDHMVVTWWSHGDHMVVTWWSHGGHVLQHKYTCMLGVSIVAHLCIEEESPQLVWHPNVEVQDDNTAKHS